MDHLSAIREDIIGEGVVIETPYGKRRTTYADHAASGRLYRPIERFLCENVAPFYGNVHSETSAVGAQTIAFREEARNTIRAATFCGPEDAVIFTGNGATGAVATLLSCLGLRGPSRNKERALVLLGPYEHHSSEIPFREADCDVEVIKECDIDGIDLDDLRRKLVGRRGFRVFGSFSAGSNVTGRLTNVAAVATLVHDHGGSVFFDYAAAGPYTSLRMCGENPLAYADAAFLSMHKFVGGPGAPGVLLMKKRLGQNACPSTPGGGTVSYVHPHRHTYLKDIEHREEGGTPDILGSIKAGLAMRLKESVGQASILAHEQDFAGRAIGAWRAEPNLVLLGGLNSPRLGIVSFMVCYEGRALHHNFVVALLNDLFGIQARGGNSCAGPYAHRLLRLSEHDEVNIEAAVATGWHGAKPGWSRISFGWYDSPETLTYVTECVLFVARFGWAFLPDYEFNPASGSWKHRGWESKLLTLSSPVESRLTLSESVRLDYLAEAMTLALAERTTVEFVPTPFEHMRWFWLPGEK